MPRGRAAAARAPTARSPRRTRREKQKCRERWTTAPPIEKRNNLLFQFFYFHKSDVKLQFCHTWWSRKKISTVYACIWSLFFKWSKPDLFLIFSNTKFHKKWLQRDSNSDRRSKRQASWPLDLHLGPVCPLFLSFQKWHKDLRRVLRRHTFATS